MWRWLTILAFIWSTSVSAEEQPKVLDIFDPTDIVKHYIGPEVFIQGSWNSVSRYFFRAVTANGSNSFSIKS